MIRNSQNGQFNPPPDIMQRLLNTDGDIKLWKHQYAEIRKRKTVASMKAIGSIAHCITESFTYEVIDDLMNDQGSFILSRDSEEIAALATMVKQAILAPVVKRMCHHYVTIIDSSISIGNLLKI